MTALECLADVAAHVGGRLDGVTLYIGDQRVASTDGKRVKVWHALVFNGHCHEVPVDCDDAVTTPRHHRDPVGRIVAAIELRQAARAKSLPVPAGDPGRDLEEIAA